jgi:HD-GYP domain-containing protein (c-di-GMP phosphodiesterase class II)
MKKRFHRRLAARIVLVAIITLAICLGAAAIFEYNNLHRMARATAQSHGSVVFPLLAWEQFSTDPTSGSDIYEATAIAMAQTPFIFLRVLDPRGSELFTHARLNGAELMAAFSPSSSDIPAQTDATSTIHWRDKRLYLTFILPLLDGETGAIRGYLNGVYQMPVADLRTLLNRLLISLGLVTFTVVVGAIICYVGMFLLNRQMIGSFKSLNRANYHLLKELSLALAKSDCRDPGHGLRMVIYAVSLAARVRVPAAHYRGLIYGALLHDVAMVPLPVSLLHKDAQFTAQERTRLYDHPRIGASFLKKLPWLAEAAEVVRHHHEHYDGSGYPDSIDHENIPLTARIVAIADCFDALTSPRPQREPVPVEEAMHVMEKDSGQRFDPVLLASFFAIAPALYKRLHSLSLNQLDKEVDKKLKSYLPV